MKIIPATLAAAVLTVMVPAAVLADPGQTHSPGIGHTLFMRGTVVHAAGNQLVVCIGRADGAQPGQELTAYRVSEHPHGPKGPPIFQRNRIGMVRIDRVTDEHFAQASVLSGTVRLNDIVELERP